MSLYREHGIVLRTYKLGEADRIVVLMTQTHGKVRAVAKGVRKTKSRFGGRLEPTSHVSLLLYEGRELDIISQAESVDHFRPIREDLDRLAAAVNMLEVVDQVAQERESSPRLYQMLLGALRTLAAKPSVLVVAGFFWKLLDLEGLRPELDHCVTCGSDVDLVAFDVDQGGVLCRTCRRGVPISPEALALMRRILGGGLASALDEPRSATTHEVEVLATRSMEHHLERRIRSMTVLDRG
ncbi:MAG: DNA repair protein RecO [Actinobacteria bacterium]|nr:MAG: DNA repair protein RecO [Actinomycetota bacterium]